MDKQGRCKKCRREYDKGREIDRNERARNRRNRNPRAVRNERLKYKYGIDIDFYEYLVEQQHGKCKICGDTPLNGKILSVDHDHVTGKVRGLLCTACNTSLGIFGDDLEGVLKVVAYLKGD